jgi:hypothetical protein
MQRGQGHEPRTVSQLDTGNGPSGHSRAAISKVEAPEFLFILRGVFWSFWVDFHGVGSISNIFGAHFSTFRHFSSSDTRVSNGSGSRTMYYPSRIQFASFPLQAFLKPRNTSLPGSRLPLPGGTCPLACKLNRRHPGDSSKGTTNTVHEMHENGKSSTTLDPS